MEDEYTLSSLFNEYISVTLTGKVLSKISRSFPELLKDPLRFEGLLKDIYSTDNKKEIFLLTIALKARIIDHFQLPGYSNCIENGIESMTKKLTMEYGLEERSSKWATMAWVLGLNLITEEEFNRLSNKMEQSKIKSNNNLFNVSSIFGRKNIFNENLKSNEFNNSEKNIGNNQSITVSNPRNVDEWNTHGLSFHNQGKYQQAIDCYDKALAIEPMNGKIISNKGLALHNQGKYQQAIDCYDKALAIEPQDEFIKRRKDQSNELIKRTKINDIAKCLPKSNKAKKRANKTFFIGAIFIIIATSLGVGVYFFIINNIHGNFFGINSNHNLFPYNNPGNDDFSSNINTELNQKGLRYNDHIAEKKRVTEYTNIIANAINNGSITAKQTSQIPSKTTTTTTTTIPTSSSSSPSSNLQITNEIKDLKSDNQNTSSQSKNSIGYNGMEDINLLRFKTELEKAMGSQFN